MVSMFDTSTVLLSLAVPKEIPISIFKNTRDIIFSGKLVNKNNLKHTMYTFS